MFDSSSHRRDSHAAPSDGTSFTAIVLAGSRATSDSFVRAAGVESKALIPIGGIPMVERVVKTLKATPSIEHIIIMAQDAAHIRAACPGLFDTTYAPGVSTVPTKTSVCESIISAIDAPDTPWPFIVTTGDHPLLTSEMVDELCAAAAGSDASMLIGLVERRLFDRFYPQNRRTFIPLKDTQVTGCNLFALKHPDSIRALKFWRQVENDRKRPWRLFRIWGWKETIRLALRRITLQAAFREASIKLGAEIAPVCLSIPEAAIDVDKASDLELATEILLTRDAKDGTQPPSPPPGEDPSARKIAIFDLDRTITKRGTFTPYLLSSRKAGLQRARLMIPILGSMLLYKLGRISRRQLKDRMLARSFRGVSAQEAQETAHRFVVRLKRNGLRPGALRAIEAHRQAGDYLVLATASMDFFAEILGKELGFDAVVATRTSWTGSGEDGGPCLEGENCYGADKLNMLQKALNGQLEQDDIGRQIVFYSDHHTDMPLFQWAHQAIAVNPSRRLKAMAQAEGLQIEYW